MALLRQHSSDRDDTFPTFCYCLPDSEVTLIAEGREIHVCKKNLADSTFFAALLSSPDLIKKDNSFPRLEIDQPYDNLLLCIEIVARRAVSPSGFMNLKKLRGLMESADQLDLALARQFCENELMMQDGDRVTAYLMACHFNYLKAKDTLMKRINVNDLADWNRKSVGAEYADLNISVAHLQSLTRMVTSIYTAK